MFHRQTCNVWNAGADISAGSERLVSPCSSSCLCSFSASGSQTPEMSSWSSVSPLLLLLPRFFLNAPAFEIKTHLFLWKGELIFPFRIRCRFKLKLTYSPCERPFVQLMTPGLRQRCITTLWSTRPTSGLWPSVLCCSPMPSHLSAAAPPAAPPSSPGCRRYRSRLSVCGELLNGCVQVAPLCVPAPEWHVRPSSGCPQLQLVWRSAKSAFAPSQSQHTYR